ncbi:unnamed protein product [Parajaminaea phylloscopi]
MASWRSRGGHAPTSTRSRANAAHSSHALTSLTCKRCLQPLRLDESLSDDALQASATSSASSSNDGGLTKSNYDVIASIVPKDDSRPEAVPASKAAAIHGIEDAELRKAAAEHYDKLDKARSPPAAASVSPDTSLSSRIALHARLFDLVSAYAPTTPSTATSGSAPVATSPQELTLGIDHPLCCECSEYCISVMRKQIETARSHRDAFVEWNAAAEKAQSDGKEVQRMEAEIVELETLVKQITSSLGSAERTKLALEEESKRLDLEEKALEQQETDFWNSYSKLLAETEALEATRDTLRRSIHTSEKALDRLNATNVFFDAFSIGHEGGSSGGSGTANEPSNSRRPAGAGGVATINGLRFGRVSSASGRGSGSGGSSSSATVDWNEVNAAWGQVALLLENLRVKIGALAEGVKPGVWTAAGHGSKAAREFVGWRVHPKGSTSFMDKLPPPPAVSSSTSRVSSAPPTSSDKAGAAPVGEPHELHHPNAWASLTRLLHRRRFDAAMVGVLDCTSQLFRWAEEAEAKAASRRRGGPATETAEGPPRMIHAINGDKIGDINIRLVGPFVPEESWSRALKYLLVNLQVLMRWATKDEVVEPTRQ